MTARRNPKQSHNSNNNRQQSLVKQQQQVWKNLKWDLNNNKRIRENKHKQKCSLQLNSNQLFSLTWFFFFFFGSPSFVLREEWEEEKSLLVFPCLFVCFQALLWLFYCCNMYVPVYIFFLFLQKFHLTVFIFPMDLLCPQKPSIRDMLLIEWLWTCKGINFVLIADCKKSFHAYFELTMFYVNFTLFFYRL